VAKGADPALERTTARQAPTVSEFGTEYLDDVRGRRKPATAREYARLWAKNIAPALGSHRVTKVATADVARVHRALRSTPYVANRVLAVVGSFFTYAERQGVRSKHTNPARDVEPFPESSRERFLNPDEVARLGSALARAARNGLRVLRARPGIGSLLRVERGFELGDAAREERAQKGDGRATDGRSDRGMRTRGCLCRLSGAQLSEREIHVQAYDSTFVQQPRVLVAV
jgi:integrase